MVGGLFLLFYFWTATVSPVETSVKADHPITTVTESEWDIPEENTVIDSKLDDSKKHGDDTIVAQSGKEEETDFAVVYLFPPMKLHDKFCCHPSKLKCNKKPTSSPPIFVSSCLPWMNFGLFLVFTIIFLYLIVDELFHYGLEINI